jgi:hypothetical protein
VKKAWPPLVRDKRLRLTIWFASLADLTLVVINQSKRTAEQSFR